MVIHINTRIISTQRAGVRNSNFSLTYKTTFSKSGVTLLLEHHYRLEINMSQHTNACYVEDFLETCYFYLVYL